MRNRSTTLVICRSFHSVLFTQFPMLSGAHAIFNTLWCLRPCLYTDVSKVLYNHNPSSLCFVVTYCHSRSFKIVHLHREDDRTINCVFAETTTTDALETPPTWNARRQDACETEE